MAPPVTTYIVQPNPTPYRLQYLVSNAGGAGTNSYTRLNSELLADMAFGPLRQLFAQAAPTAEEKARAASRLRIVPTLVTPVIAPPGSPVNFSVLPGYDGSSMLVLLLTFGNTAPTDILVTLEFRHSSER